jgi:hypothetical protein
MLNAAREMVVALAEHADQLEITQADTHYIGVEGPARLIEALIDRGLLSGPAHTKVLSEQVVMSIGPRNPALFQGCVSVSPYGNNTLVAAGPGLLSPESEDDEGVA